jgi:hypothetical protein
VHRKLNIKDFHEIRNQEKSESQFLPFVLELQYNLNCFPLTNDNCMDTFTNENLNLKLKVVSIYCFHCNKGNKGKILCVSVGLTRWSSPMPAIAFFFVIF